ncbi:tRNA-modifying enzyme [candidate division MSBL1 archaeon SCGC-AAA259A05]|uniref:S-adenosyl-L-methionine-dependent tRNA 4-demethylwyosine synthase n=1 Tax=candidate division MSBL1 archaeon SCGC-AAA259A05 TaxID=1698259 RepID=A0A133UBA5_9EURY|nr:tRNA-modifying enzyme [candidate division MSBL1 archaeon SCGC-AAA259A05]
MKLSRKALRRLEKGGYRLVGKNKHSAVKICRWTKKSLLEEGICYKQKFYEDIHGIKSHRCLQMTPSLPFCDNKCVFCWRDVNLNSPYWEGPADDPSEILDEAIEAQRSLLSGFKGNPEANKEKWDEAQNPGLAAISLDGEPTLYPKLDGLIEECYRRDIVPFLVTNGLHPDRLEEIREPAQLYISTVAPDGKTYKKICRPLVSRAWEKLNQSLEVMQSFDCTKVLRLTMVKGWNMKDPSGYGELIKKVEPDFVEPKGYMFVGHSRKRLKMENMPTHEEIKNFGRALERETGYTITDESEPSRVVLLSAEN